MPDKNIASALYRAIPATDICMRALREKAPELESLPQALLRTLVNEYWDKVRADIRNGHITSLPALEDSLSALLAHVQCAMQPMLRTVLNGTGVVVHTNLGRSVLAEQAARAAYEAGSNYCNLEMNLRTGQRGSRHDLVEQLLRRLTGSQAAMAVNNNAAAVLLILDSLCSGGEVIVSRGELIEIGGSFRIPDIMARSGATLVEVGTTNRTHLKDYQAAISERTAAIFCAHASNFRITGFHTAPDLPDLKVLAQEHGLPLIYDLGSGSMLDFSPLGLPADPTVPQLVESGVDIACFSGDKALGGPQAGIIVGRRDLVEKCKKNPLARALRCDKLCLAALEATLRLYLNPKESAAQVPTVRMISMGEKDLASAARSLAARIRREFRMKEIPCGVSLQKDVSRVGGGAFPECDLPTTLVRLNPACISAQTLRDRLLAAQPALVGRLEGDGFCLDPRTLSRDSYAKVAAVLAWALGICAAGAHPDQDKAEQSPEESAHDRRRK